MISEKPFGHYDYAKRFSHGVEELCRVEVFSTCASCASAKPGWRCDQRATQWFPAEEAMELVSDPELGDLIGGFRPRSLGLAATGRC